MYLNRQSTASFPVGLRAALAVSVLGVLTAVAPAEPVVFARHLSLSPDGATLAFSWAGDIWTVSAEGGSARRLTAHPSSDTAPVFSRDGRQIAFASARYGSADVFVMNRDGGGVQRLTFGDRPETPCDWTAKNDAVIFVARMDGQVSWDPALYSVPAAGGEPYKLFEANGADGALSPDGSVVAFTRGGERWWRRRYRGSANNDIWLCELATKEFRRLTEFDGVDRLPLWDADGDGVYFLSDRVGTVNVWYQPISGDARQVTDLPDDDVRDLAVSADGKTLAFTHWDKVYILPNGQRRPRAIQIDAAADVATTTINRETKTTGADELATAPSGEELAVVERGEIYVVKTKEDQPTRQVTNRAARDWQVSWSPDGKALFFVSDENGREEIYRATSAEIPAKALSDSLRFKIERVTTSPSIDTAPQISPDGKQLSFVRGRGDLVVRDLASGEERTLFAGWNPPNYAWSPDSKWIAYAVEDAEFNSDIWIRKADGSEPPVNISQHPDNDGSPTWSADGQVLAFNSQRAGMDADVYLVFLARELDEMSVVERNEYFEAAAKAAEKRKPLKDCVASGKIALADAATPTSAPASAPAENATASQPAGDESADEKLRKMFKAWLDGQLQDAKKDDESDEKAEKDDKDVKPPKKYDYDLAHAYERIRRVTSLPGDQTNFALTLDGKTVFFTSGHDGEPGLYKVNWNGDEQKKVIGGAHGALQFALNGKRLFYLKGGVPGSLTNAGNNAETHKFRAKLVIDYAAEARQKFDDAARQMGLRFYHPTLKDLDWEALTKKYRELALQTQTIEEFNEIFAMLLGELNGSHLGIYPPRDGGGNGESTGYLGCWFDPAFEGPGLRITRVLPDSPAARQESKLNVGDVILEINGQPVGPGAPAAAALVETAGEQVVLKVMPAATASAPADGGADAASQPAAPSTREVVIRPTSFGAFNDLCYEDWVRDNRRSVEQATNGRVGYAHIRAMAADAFYRFERDLYAAANGKDGLIIDVRYNGGGWTADWVMQVLSVRRHAYTIARGGERGYPQDRLVFYAWTKPATMMCNQFSYSNAEIISHAFKNLQRGPLVGMPTWGAVISTGSYGLIDGGAIRMPFRGWYTLPGELDMELNGAQPDIVVELGPADEVARRDPQLDAAIKATLEQLEQKP